MTHPDASQSLEKSPKVNYRNVASRWSMKVAIMSGTLAAWLAVELLDHWQLGLFVMSFPEGVSSYWVLAKLCVFIGLLGGVLHLALRPLHALGVDLSNRKNDELQPVSTSQPQELAQLAEAVNKLLEQQRLSHEQQKKFLTDASHQLRTPFAVLRTQIQGVISGELSAARTMPQMLNTVDRSSELVRQLLALAKVEQTVQRNAWEKVDLRQIARDCSVEFAPLFAKKNLSYSLDAVSLTVSSDPWMLGELIRNLLSNAVRHTPSGKSLGIVIRILPSGPELLVWDNGGGMDENVQARLFEPFQSASDSGGIGLGLSICRQIASSMNATVELFNRIQDDELVGVDAVVRWPQDATSGLATSHEGSKTPKRNGDEFMSYLARDKAFLVEGSSS